MFGCLCCPLLFLAMQCLNSGYLGDPKNYIILPFLHILESIFCLNLRIVSNTVIGHKVLAKRKKKERKRNSQGNLQSVTLRG